MAHTKAKGSTKLGRESESKRLGVKKFHGQKINAGEVIVRQRGTKFYPGDNVKKGSDDTLYATKSGILKFAIKSKYHFDGKKQKVKVISVV
ncbi:MAG: 50S ribosomal protein L27 [Minisyncoccia bacterium]